MMNIFIAILGGFLVFAPFSKPVNAQPVTLQKIDDTKIPQIMSNKEKVKILFIFSSKNLPSPILKELSAIRRKYKKNDLAIVAIMLDFNKKQGTRELKKKIANLGFPIHIDAEKTFSNILTSYGLVLPTKESDLPYIALLNRKSFVMTEGKYNPSSLLVTIDYLINYSQS